MQYSEYVLEALRKFNNGETYQYNIDILAPYGLVDSKGRNPRISETGRVVGWRITPKGKQVLIDNTGLIL